jgi:AcrR family transcriptional regulator
MKTKDKILLSALKLFNLHGVINVRLQHIADESHISVGNLAYHYVDKEKIVMGLVEKLRKEQSILLANYMAVPLFEHIDNIINRNYILQQEFKFYYLDTLEIFRRYEKIKEHSQKSMKLQIIQIEGMFNFNVARGVFNKECMNKDLAISFWMVGQLWMYEQFILGNESYQITEYKKRIWSIIEPYFTSMGKEEFQRL